MKRILFLLASFAILFSVDAQNSYLGINLGMSIPGSDFAGSESLFDHGYAVSGFSIEFDGVYFPGSVFGIGGMMGFGSYYTLQDSYFDNVRNYIESHPDLTNYTFPLRNELNYESGFWNVVNIMAGPELAVPFWNFQLGVRAMGGPSLIISPQKYISYEDAQEMLLIKSRGTRLGLSYVYGGSLMYFLSPGTSLRLVADYYNGKSRSKFEAEIETPLDSLSEETESDIKINSLQLSVGLSYAF